MRGGVSSDHAKEKSSKTSVTPSPPIINDSHIGFLLLRQWLFIVTRVESFNFYEDTKARWGELSSSLLFCCCRFKIFIHWLTLSKLEIKIGHAYAFYPSKLVKWRWCGSHERGVRANSDEGWPGVGKGLVCRFFSVSGTRDKRSPFHANDSMKRLIQTNKYTTRIFLLQDMYNTRELRGYKLQNPQEYCPNCKHALWLCLPFTSSW